MEKIIKKVKVGIAKDKAFQKFLNELNEWWPKEYTWSQDKLKEIRIDGKKDGIVLKPDHTDFAVIGAE